MTRKITIYGWRIRLGQRNRRRGEQQMQIGERL
jgi:hypothetical protein